MIRVEADGTQRLWRFDRNGGNRRWCFQRSSQSVITPGWMRIDWSSSSSGRQRFRPHRWQPARGTVVASDVGRSILRMPGGNSISFVERLETGEHWVKELNPMTGASTPLVIAPPGSTERDCAWLPDGRF